MSDRRAETHSEFQSVPNGSPLGVSQPAPKTHSGTQRCATLETKIIVILTASFRRLFPNIFNPLWNTNKDNWSGSVFRKQVLDWFRMYVMSRKGSNMKAIAGFTPARLRELVLNSSMDVVRAGLFVLFQWLKKVFLYPIGRIKMKPKRI